MALATRGIKPPVRSKFESWLDGLNESNAAVVLGWLSDLEYSNAAVARMIADDDPEDDFTGYRANKDTIADWRRAHVAP